MNEHAESSGSPPSARDRLLLACADLASYGILARPAIELDPDTARGALPRAITRRFPHATGSYIFWTAADEACFRADGSLRQSLYLHRSGADVAAAAHACLRHVSLAAADLVKPPRLRIDADAGVVDISSRAHLVLDCSGQADPRFRI